MMHCFDTFSLKKLLLRSADLTIRLNFQPMGTLNNTTVGFILFGIGCSGVAQEITEFCLIC